MEACCEKIRKRLSAALMALYGRVEALGGEAVVAHVRAGPGIRPEAMATSVPLGWRAMLRHRRGSGCGSLRRASTMKGARGAEAWVKEYPFDVLLTGKKISGAFLSDQVMSLDWRARKAKFIEKADESVLRDILAKLFVVLD